MPWMLFVVALVCEVTAAAVDAVDGVVIDQDQEPRVTRRHYC